MNFFEQQERARRKTTQLVIYYGLAVALIIATLYVVVVLLFRAGQAHGMHVESTPLTLWDPVLFGWVALGAGVLILAGTLYKIASLSSGGGTVARMLGGEPVAPNTSDPQERRILNVVEEMAIASGTKIPPVYILNEEEGINAFAAGFSPNDAVIAVTRGCARLLTRDELQGVIGHEFSHILNGDMRLNLRLIGVLNGILVIALVGYGIFRITLNSSSGRRVSRDKKGEGGAALAVMALGLAMIVIGYIGVVFGRLIKSAISRQREFLADASAVQFTRNPPGIAGALKKIGGFSQGSRILCHRAEEASHLFFANGVGSFFLNLMATHPPLLDRIRRIEPDFDGVFPAVSAAAPAQDEQVSRITPQAASATSRGAASPPPQFAIRPAEVVATVGTPQPEHVAHAANLLASLPQEIRLAVREPLGAQAVIFGLLLNEPAAPRAKQLAYLSTHANPAIYQDLRTLLSPLARIAPEARLTTADVAFSALRRLSQAQYEDFRGIAYELTSADMEISLFEYALLRMMLRNLDPLYGLAKRPATRYTAIETIAAEGAMLLSALAWYGNDNADQAALAFQHSLREIDQDPGLLLLPEHQCSLEDVDKALDKLMSASPALKQRLVAACVACVSADGKVTIAEAELLRAVADSLECPIPPFLPLPA